MRISDWSSDVCSSDLSTVVEPDRHMLWRNPLDLTQRAVLHPKPALVLEEHDAVAAGELPRAPLGLHLHVGTKRSRVTQACARGQGQIANLGIGVGEGATAIVRIGKGLRDRKRVVEGKRVEVG